MTKRDIFLKTIKREMEGYVPFEFSLCPSLVNKFKQKTGRTDYVEYFNMPARYIAVEALPRKVDFSTYFKDKGSDISVDHWGVGYIQGSLEHFNRMVHPMEDFETIEEFKSFPYPNVEEDYNWDKLPSIVESIKKSDLIAVASMAITIFEIAWYLRGMDQFMVDLMMQPELACYHMDRITHIRCECARRYARAGVDILHVGDDVATQRDMMMSPEMWRKFLKPRLKKVIDAAREVNPDILIDYHSDGNVESIIPDLIEIGVDILNPVQPECMDPVKIKELYGDKLSFRGTIGTQTTMPFGSAEEVKRVCREMIDKIGKGGGFILAPTHVLEPEVPWENIEAMLSVVNEYWPF
ncbi:MAG: uroporphyrinogen decarboxylase family protein [Caldicoprobacterales bacterium]|nr:hypothetical protein [Clostridiales bacterium]